MLVGDHREATGSADTSRAGRPLPETDPRPTLSRCIGIPTAEFAGRVWATAPLLTPAAPGAQDFDDLFSAAAVDELISARGLRTPFLRMAKNGSVLATSTFTRSGGVGAGIADQVADDKVLAQLAGGATLVLQALHRTWPPLIRFGGDLARELGHPVQINAYITPPENQGFAAHYDTHDVFVLQVAGSKRWTIHRPVIDDPLPTQTWEQRKAQVAARATEEPLIDTLLRPGDALYLPRGFLHSAVAQGEVSIHLTVGVHPVTAYDLAQELIVAAAADRELRRSLPLGVDVTDPAAMREHVRGRGQATVRGGRAGRCGGPRPCRAAGLAGSRSARPGRRRSAPWRNWPRCAAWTRHRRCTCAPACGRCCGPPAIARRSTSSTPRSAGPPRRTTRCCWRCPVHRSGPSTCPASTATSSWWWPGGCCARAW